MAKRLTLEEVEKRSQEIHNGKYQYNYISYIGKSPKVSISCKKHGEFFQGIHKHLKGSGCPKCGIERRALARTMKISEFISKANIVHNNSYSYENSIYVNSQTKLNITCPEHGEFWQTPNNHLSEYGCPICRSSKGELKVTKFLTELGVKYETQKSFKSMKHVGKLRIDFYISDYKIGIEYDGIQHFQPIDHFGGTLGYINCKIRDNIKTNFCKDNNILLIRIRYDRDILRQLDEVRSTIESIISTQ